MAQYPNELYVLIMHNLFFRAVQYTDDLTDVFKDYINPDGSAVEFRILDPSLSVLNLPIPIETRYLRLIIQNYVVSPCLQLELMG